MKISIVLSLSLALVVLLTGCSEDPGPIPENMSRIKVKCTGFDFNDHEVLVTATRWPGTYDQRKDLGCFFSETIYFDVPIPPYSYDVQNGRAKGTVVFSGPGEQQSVDYKAFIITYSGSL